MILPSVQFQNPAISGCTLGWASCTSFSTAMAGSYDRQVAKLVTGCAVRKATGDTIGGTTLAQNDDALRSLTGVDLDTRYRLPWADFASKINAGRGAVLQLWYQPISVSKFDAGGGFTGNHAIFVPPGWGAMDPLADGRRAGIYKYHGEAYPQSLLKTAAGRLNVAPIGYSALGAGLVYAAFTRDNTKTYHLAFLGGAFFVYKVDSMGVITGRTSMTFSTPTGAPCDPPRLHKWPGHTSRSLVRISAGKLENQYVGISSSSVRLDEIP